MKRFTETNKWRDPWYRKLSSPAKQLWEYLRDNCDAIGLIEIDFTLVSGDCGQKIDESHIAEIGDRAQNIGPGRFFLPKFIRFQYGELTAACPPHRPIIALVESHKLVRVGLHYAYPTCIEEPYPNGRVALPLRQDKTRQVQEKDKTREEGAQREGEELHYRVLSLKSAIGNLYGRNSKAAWSYAEESALAAMMKRESLESEVVTITKWRQRIQGKDLRFVWPSTMTKLLEDWTGCLDKARTATPKRYEPTL